MSSSSMCNDLLGYPSAFVRTDLIELNSWLLDELLRDARTLYDNMRTFERQCIRLVSRDVYDLVVSMYHLALLKLSTTLEDKLRGSRIEDEFIQFIVRYYTQDEKNALRELERFSKLDPNVTRPEILADIIVAEEGEIYRLVREAVNKEYVDLGRVLKTWESQLTIRNNLTRAFINVYQARFNNIINAIQLLLNQQPGWLKRLFKEYENALLESAEVRKRFEEKFKEVFGVEKSKLEDALRKLEEENSLLRKRLEELSTELILAEDEKKKRHEELSTITSKYESLVNSYKSLLEDYNKKVTELETIRKELIEKERELEKIKNSREASQAERLALENEIIQLRKALSDYEKQIQEYKLLEGKVKELESALKGEATGNIVRREEVEYFFQVVSGRSRRILEDDEVKVFDPRSSDYKTVKKWDMIDKTSSSISGATNTFSVKSIIFTKLTGLWPLSKRRDIVIEYAVLTHFTEFTSKEFDAQPIDISELSALLRDRLDEAEREGYYYILIAVSPTGFTKGLVNYIAGGNIQWMSVASRYTTIYLVDLVKGKIYYNSHDPIAKYNKFLANLELREEQVERVVNYVQSSEARLEAVKRNPTVNFLSLDDISTATGVSDKLILRRALGILEENGVGRVKKIDNKLVFEYIMN